MDDERMRNRLRSATDYRSVPRAVPHPQTHQESTSTQSESTKPHSHKKLLLIIVIVTALVGFSTTAYFMFIKKDNKANQLGVLGDSTAKGITIPLYYPKNLPSGYIYNNDGKALKSNIYYLSVSGPNKQVFHITQQPIPASFDFIGFSKKFLSPDTFTTASGTITAGPVGTTMLGSIRTNKNTWIIINSSAGSTLAQLEVVARSFELGK